MQLSTQISFCRAALQPFVPLSISKALFLSSKPVLSSHNFKRLIKRDFLLVNPRNLGVHRELGGDTARTADPNWPKGCPIACGAMWDKNIGGLAGEATVAERQGGHQVACGDHHCESTSWLTVFSLDNQNFPCYCLFLLPPVSLLNISRKTLSPSCS